IDCVINFGIAGAYQENNTSVQAGMLDLCLAEQEFFGDLGIQFYRILYLACLQKIDIYFFLTEILLWFTTIMTISFHLPAFSHTARQIINQVY
ncbi:MAG: hypothetical protein D3919_07590, partial [Candidatus Electrothrix sp. AW5]|nr:hypothetical protein [Candidatus Electrothrix gigas]